jgi:hypothetical protein
VSRATTVGHEFVQLVPDELEPATLYISIAYDTIVHSCLCGCGLRVVTPLSPAEWRLTYDGKTVSLSPSVGNWSFPCQSHYVIAHGRVRWAAQFSRHRVENVRKRDRQDLEAQLTGRPHIAAPTPDTARTQDSAPAPGSDPGPAQTPPWWRRAVRKLARSS